MAKSNHKINALKLSFVFGFSLLGLFFIGLQLGPPTLSLSQLLAFEWPAYIIQLRVPRLLTATIVGGGLGVAGATLQGVFRNPLADPGLIGVSAGAAVGACIAISILGFNFANGLADWIGSYFVTLCAFFGGVVAVSAVVVLSSSSGVSSSRGAHAGGGYIISQHRRMSNTTLLLVGMAVNAMCFAMVGLLSYFASDQAMRDIIAWSLGSFEGVRMSTLWIMGIVLLVSLALITFCAKPLDVMALGEAEARQLGVNVGRVKWSIILGSALLVGLGVAVAGVIGFIGLVAPHMVRLLVGSQHKLVLPLSFLVGAALLISAEILARTLYAPVLLPVGVITAAVGAPLFLWLVVRFNRLN